MSADLLAMQAPKGVPRSEIFSTVTDPLLPPQQMSEMLAHFHEAIYDLKSEGHLARLLKVLLGDTGTSQLRKRYTYTHLSHFLLTAHYNDLDQLFAEVLGLKRFLRERLNIDVYLDAATDEEWEAIDAADASYRSRVAMFARALSLAGTPSGMVAAASAIIGDEVRVYETYEFLDNAETYAAVEVATTNTWGDLEWRDEAMTQSQTYGGLQGRTYAGLEGSTHFEGRTVQGRGEFIVRPLRTITDEERLHLVRALDRIKPAEALMTIDARAAAVYTPVPVARASATSTYWHVQSRVHPDPGDAQFYARYSEDGPVEQPKAAFSQYQGEVWNYNSDVAAVTSYVEEEDGTVVQEANFERWTDSTGQVIDQTPEKALTDPEEILRGRSVSDGVLTAPVAVRSVR